MATIAELLAAEQRLVEVSDTPRLDVEVLLTEAIDKPRSYLFTWPERELQEQQAKRFWDMLSRRIAGEPVAHIIGRREFWSLNLRVSPATLVPRPDTEILVETALNRVTQPQAKVLDLGTGTGAVAIALASERPQWSLVAVDCIPQAVALAQQNAAENQVANITIFQSDWFSQITQRGLGPFDAIVSNPPYIDQQDKHLRQGDLRFEPASALVSEEAGLADIRKIIERAIDHLVAQGWLLLEHGFQQGQKVRELLESNGYTSIQTVTDLSGQERVTVAQRL